MALSVHMACGRSKQFGLNEFCKSIPFDGRTSAPFFPGGQRPDKLRIAPSDSESLLMVFVSCPTNAGSYGP